MLVPDDDFGTEAHADSRYVDVLRTQRVVAAEQHDVVFARIRENRLVPLSNEDDLSRQRCAYSRRLPGSRTF